MVPSRWLSRRSFPYPANRFTLRLYGCVSGLFITWTAERPTVIAENLGGWRSVLAEAPVLTRQKRLDRALSLGGLA